MSGNTVTTDAETAGPSVLTAIDEYMHAYVVPTFTKGWQHYLDNGTFSLHDIANPQTLAEDMRAKYEELGKYADYVFKDDAGYKRAMVGYTEEQRQDAMRTMVEEADRDARASVIFDAALPLADKAGFDEKIPELVRSLRPSQRLQASLALRGAREFASALNAYRDDGKERDDREAAYVSLLESVGGHGKKDVAATVKTTLAVRDLLRKTDLTTTRLMTRDSQRVALEKNQMPEKPHRTMEQRQVIRSLTKAVQSRWGDAVAKGSPNADQLEVALVYLGAKKQAPEPDTASKRSEYVPNEFGPTAVHLPGSTQSRSTADRLRRGAKWGALGAMAGYAGNLLNSAAAVAEPVTPAIGQHSIESRAASQPLSLDDIRQRVAPPGQTQAMDTVPLANAAAPLQQSDAQPQQGVPAAASQETNIAVPAFKAPEQTAAAVNTTPGQEFVGVPLGPLNEPTLPQAAANTPAAASFVNTNTGHVTDGHPKPAESSSSTGHDTHTGQPSASEQVVVAAPAAAAPAAGMVAVQNIMAEQSLAKSDFEQALENNSISFQDLLDKYENTVLEASTTHFDLTDNPGYLQNTMTQAEGLYASIVDPNSGLTADQITAAKQHLVNAVMAAKYKDITENADFQSALAPKDAASQPELPIYVQAIEPQYTDAQNGAVGNSEGVSSDVMSTVTLQLAYAEASMHDQNGRLTLLQGLNEQAYTDAQTAIKTYNDKLAADQAAQLAAAALHNSRDRQDGLGSQASGNSNKANAGSTHEQNNGHYELNAHQRHIIKSLNLSARDEHLLTEFVVAAGSRVLHGDRMDPSAVTAQAIHESGWASSELAYKYGNLFGQKADSNWHGPTVDIGTWEDDANGNPYRTIATWEVYQTNGQADYGKAFDNYAQRIGNAPWYKDAMACAHLGPRAYLQALVSKMDPKTCRVVGSEPQYATDVNYVKNVMARVKELKLQQIFAAGQSLTIQRVHPSQHQHPNQVVHLSPQAAGARMELLVKQQSWHTKHGAFDAKPSYTKALTHLVNSTQNLSGNQHFQVSSQGADCHNFVAEMLHTSGIDVHVPPIGTYEALPYYLDHPELYKQIANRGAHTNLDPGKMYIFIFNHGMEGHTWVQFGDKIYDMDAAGASWNDQMPYIQSASWYLNQSGSSFDDGRGPYHIFEVQ